MRQAGPQLGTAGDAPSRRRAVRVLVVDDHEVVREGITTALGTGGEFEIVAAVATAEAALSAAGRTRPDIALVDLRLAHGTGDVLCAELRERHPQLAVVMLSSYVSEDTVRTAMDAGASAYVTKAAGLTELRETLLSVADDHQGENERRIVGQLRSLVSRREQAYGLTRQQQLVLELSAEGLNYREIGARLFISESTVRFHMQKLKSKFAVRTKTELVARAIRSGALAPATEATGGEP
jgi:DNA-binding NarL/FixJ family response regulator